MNINLQFFLKVMAVLDNSEKIKEHIEICKECKMYRNNRCKKGELCMRAFSKILNDHPSNITRKLNRINQYFKNIGDSVIYTRIDADAPRNKPRKFIKGNHNWAKILQKAKDYEYQNNITTNLLSFSQERDTHQKLFSILKTNILESEANMKKAEDLITLWYILPSGANMKGVISLYPPIQKTPLRKLLKQIKKKQKKKKLSANIHVKKKKHKMDKTNYEKRPSMYLKHKPTY